MKSKVLITLPFLFGDFGTVNYMKSAHIKNKVNCDLFMTLLFTKNKKHNFKNRTLKYLAYTVSKTKNVNDIQV